MASHPRNAAVKLVSAQGLYFKSGEEEKWYPLPQFRNDNHPVAISATGDLYVGSQRSRDSGKTFEEYVPWDQVLAQVVAVTHRTHDHVKITRIRFEKPGQISLLVDAGRSELVEITIKE